MKIKHLCKMKKIIEKSVFHPESLQVNNHKDFRRTKKVFALIIVLSRYICVYLQYIMEKIINKILSNELLVITFTLLIFAILDVNRWFYLLAPIVTYFVIFVVQLISILIEVQRNEKERN